MSLYTQFLLIGIGTAVIITVQHYTIGRWWRRNELARRTVGLATVLAITAVCIPARLVDALTWVIFALVIGVSGATLAALVIQENEIRKQAHVQAERERAKRHVEKITQ